MARSLWSDRPLGVKLGAIVAAGAVSLGAFALISVQALQAPVTAWTRSWPRNRTTAEALEADMMHDAVRADVLQALSADHEATSTRPRSPTWPTTRPTSATSSAGVTADHLSADGRRRGRAR